MCMVIMFICVYINIYAANVKKLNTRLDFNTRQKNYIMYELSKMWKTQRNISPFNNCGHYLTLLGFLTNLTLYVDKFPKFVTIQSFLSIFHKCCKVGYFLKEFLRLLQLTARFENQDYRIPGIMHIHILCQAQKVIQYFLNQPPPSCSCFPSSIYKYILMYSKNNLTPFYKNNKTTPSPAFRHVSTNIAKTNLKA